MSEPIGHLRLPRRQNAPAPVATKRCKTCRQALPLDAFALRKRGGQGVAANCKTCVEEHHNTGTFTCNRCSRTMLGTAFFRGANGQAIIHPCKECRTAANAEATRLRHIRQGRVPYHLLSEVDTQARTAICRECGPVHIYATGAVTGRGWRCGRRSDQLSMEWYAAKAQIVDKHAARNWHRIRDVRGEEMRGTCSLCGDVPVRWNQSGGYFTCASPVRKDRHAATERRRKRLVFYGLTPEEYENMKERQGGGCAICGSTSGRSAGGDRLVVDHDHACCPTERTCGRCVRALLCSLCNTGIGAMREDPEILLAAVEYLRKYADRPLALFLSPGMRKRPGPSVMEEPGRSLCQG